ncbi:MAG TPA: twin-arginine translocation signal domain-containing protein, partial [Gemmatimonadaceae bacterium]|nr:twin-arginine translocation signal domain-containing protein [Gemmatimonadaceae bacterium]HXD48351.1 twin-arginine translocation signal domain-containing protein [Gemmatimonadaceae bacterium]
MTDTRIPPSPEAGDSSFSRRDFLVRAGQAGAALSIAAPGFNRAWLADVASLGASADGTAVAQQQLAALHEGFRWRMLGPFRGGRTDAVTGVPGRPNEFYFGHVNGGVWKTVDGGRVWKPVFDSQSVASIGAIA